MIWRIEAVYIHFVKFLSGHFSTLACHLLLILLESYMISFKTQIPRKSWQGWYNQLNRRDRGGQVYSVQGLICLRVTYFILSVLNVVELMVRKCCLYQNITEKLLSRFPYPQLSLGFGWERQEMTRPGRQNRHFLSEGKCKLHLGLAPGHKPIFKSKCSSKSTVRRQTSWKRNLYHFLYVVFLSNKDQVCPPGVIAKCLKAYLRWQQH